MAVLAGRHCRYAGDDTPGSRVDCSRLTMTCGPAGGRWRYIATAEASSANGAGKGLG